MRRRPNLAAGIVTGVLVGAILPAVALAAAAVALSSAGELSVAIQSAQNHGMRVEPFEEATPPNRRGFRVRQDLPGRPAFTSSDGDCFVNGVANDVVCAGARTSIRVTGNAGDDSVTVAERIARVPLISSQGCAEIPPAPFPVFASLGAGADIFTLEPLCSAAFFAESFSLRVEVDGGTGSDTISGGDRNDTLRGGDGRDQLNGRRGNDVLQGDGGSDVLDGGEDEDTVTYAERASPVTARIGGASTGVGGEADEIRTSVENLTGGSAGDALFGTGGPNKLIGNGGSDELTGFAGADALVGGAGLDTIDAGDDADSISSGADVDTIRARDGVFDTISCGDGNDTVIADLADFFSDPLGFVRNKNGRDCESITTFAVDDGPPARVVGRFLRVRDGRASVAVACPRNARVACRGTLSARLGSVAGRVVGRTRYSARLGARAAVILRVGNRGRGTRIVLETKEQGVSKKGPRSATQLVLVR
ncbi:MAG: hypothetical protein ACXW0F_04815 [Gaiellaceae bacterium]